MSRGCKRKKNIDVRKVKVSAVRLVFPASRQMWGRRPTLGTYKGSISRPLSVGFLP